MAAAHRLAAGDLAFLDGRLDRLQQDCRGVVGLRRERLGVLAVLLLVLVAELLRLRIDRHRTGHRGVAHADDRLAADLGQVGGVEPVRAHELRLHAPLAGLLEEGRRLLVDAAEVDEVGVLGLDRGDDRVEVRLLLGALEADDLDAPLRGVFLEELGHALPVGRLVVDDVDRLGLELAGRELRAHHALHVVAAAHAVDVLVAAVGDGRVGVGRRDHRQAHVLVDLRGRDRDTGVEVADDAEDSACRRRCVLALETPTSGFAWSS